MKYTNNADLPLPIAVWLLHDTYDYQSDKKYVSATTLLKPVRQIVLNKRIPYKEREIDLSDLLAARMGTALHDSIEKAWTDNYKQAMLSLGYAPEIVDRIYINPTPEQIAQDPEGIHVFMEQRLFREYNGWKIGGKFDMIIQGRLFDFKSTSVWAFIKGDKDKKFIQQGSIYRWLDAKGEQMIQEENIHIQFIFTDWTRAEAKRNPDYPQQRAQEHVLPLLGLGEIDIFVADKLAAIDKYMDAPDAEIPECTPEDLWMSPTVYKYYANPANKTRATKNFDTDKAAADAHLLQQGKGVVDAIVGTPKACEWCPAYEICEQRKRMNV